MNKSVQENLFATIQTVIQSSLNRVDMTTSNLGNVKSINEKDNTCKVEIYLDEFTCKIPVSLKKYIYVGDVVLIQKFNKHERFVTGAVSRGSNSLSFIHVYDIEKEEIISTSMSLYNVESDESSFPILEIYSEETDANVEVSAIDDI